LNLYCHSRESKSAANRANHLSYETVDFSVRCPSV
jgi:hypothetical protein